MNIKISVTGMHPRPDIVWPEGWPMPRIGEEVTIGEHNLFVRHVDYYPLGDLEEKDPFIYVVIGPRPQTFL